MASEQSKVFLSKIHDSIKRGEYDKYMDIPLLSKELIYTTIKSKVNSKESKGGNPILTDYEIKECVNDAREVALNTMYILFQTGLVEKNEEGKLEVSKKGKIALKEVTRLNYD